MTEIHPFNYFMPPDPDKLIIGSFPCFNGKDYGEWFYCGSGKNEFWKLLSATYDMPIATIEDKIAVCIKHKIALTDIALEIERQKSNCSDANLRIVKYNTEGISQCLQANTKHLFFTGKFVEKHFHKLFPDVNLPSTTLPSPSPASNRHIAGLDAYKNLKNSQAVHSIYEYRLKEYARILNPENSKK